METNSIIQKAFNAGYLIHKYLPKLFSLLANGFQDKRNPYAEGFIAGGKEYEMEKVRSLPGQHQNPSKTLEMESPERVLDDPEDDLEL